MKMKKLKIYFIVKYFYIILCPIVLIGCEDFLEPGKPFGELDSSLVFEDETVATAAVTSLYGKMRDEILLTGKLEGLSVLMGVYSDEMIYYGLGGEAMDSFFQHRVFPDNLLVESIWNQSYSLIYMSNSILEGLENSETLREDFKTQLKGETLFLRSLTYFYLINLFGDVPYTMTPDYEENRTLPRMPVNQVYEYIISDLMEAKNLLRTNYVSSERTRANNMVVSSLLSRIYLYTEQWELAENEASTIINHNSLYMLESEISNEFLKESTSAILQLKPKNEGDNTLEASTFIFLSGPPPSLSIDSDLIESMELEDLRREQWIGEIVNGDLTWYYPNKYQYNTNTGISKEYSIVFRLSEQYLIRSESRVRLGNFSGALEDLNLIRNRAGLSDILDLNQNDILKALLRERYHELFSEFGHRWFDLKRFGLTAEILAPKKSGWKPTNLLLPIPESELLMNPKLKPQNPGY